jgi:hypothetical protein
LYFGALETQAEAAGGHFPADMWSQYQKYTVTVWIICPLIAGLLSRRYGERFVWSFAQLAMIPITVLLIYRPTPSVVLIVALWLGVTSTLAWVGGISLVQVVRAEKKGLSNTVMMVGLGVGSLMAPICGRAMLYWRELSEYLREDNWSSFFLSVFSFQTPKMTPGVEDCYPILWLLTLITLICGVMIGLWGQRPGRFEHELPHSWSQTVQDLGHLMRNRTFWALALSISFLAGTIFQGANQFLPYRAEELGLKSGASDLGWIWLNLLKTLMWIPGGLAVGLLAGRRAGGMAGALMIAGFAVGVWGMGFSSVAWQLFFWVAVLEFARQFIRWAQAGYISEHLPSNLRSTAIGCSVAISGLAGTIYAWAADYFWSPGISASYPLYAAFICGMIGCVGLFIYDRFYPIRQSLPDDTTAVETDAAVEEGIISEA